VYSSFWKTHHHKATEHHLPYGINTGEHSLVLSPARLTGWCLIYAPWFFLRLWRFINHLLTYLLTYLPVILKRWKTQLTLTAGYTPRWFSCPLD